MGVGKAHQALLVLWTAAASQLFTYSAVQPSPYLCKAIYGQLHLLIRSWVSWKLPDPRNSDSAQRAVESLASGIKGFVKPSELKAQWCHRGLGFCAFHRVCVGPSKSSCHEGSQSGPPPTREAQVGSVAHCSDRGASTVPLGVFLASGDMRSAWPR